MGEEHDSVTVGQGVRGRVGVVSVGDTGLREMICLLAREGVTEPRTIRLDSSELGQEAGQAAMLAGLRALQAAPDVEVIVLISTAQPPDAIGRALTRVRDSDKPTVACFLGSDQRLIWRAGAIPAARLDEAAMRAAAWVRGWDQALVSSRLADRDDRLARQADDLRRRVGPGRHALRGLFLSGLFCQEAELLLADITGGKEDIVRLHLGSEWLHRLEEALDDPRLAVVLLDVMLGYGGHPDPVGALVEALGRREERPLVIAHLCGVEAPCWADQEARLREAGVILMPSNAAAARLAGQVVRGI